METSKMAFQNLENLNSTTLLCVVDVIFKYICIKTLLGFLLEIFLSSSFQRASENCSPKAGSYL